ncbi:MAG: hypothetical protein AABW75_01330 [Nanoarchaeota archaeon]
MKVLILDKDYISSRAYANEWTYRLKAKGHDVVYEIHIINLRALNRNLSEFDVILAHPRTEDISLLDEELKRRESLRLILHSGRDSFITFNVINSPQVSYYSNNYLSSRLMELVEGDKK